MALQHGNSDGNSKPLTGYKMKTIIVVTGLARCGSSLMMQMIHAGGYPISCHPGNEAISGEHNSQTETLKQIASGSANGKAVKSLDPLNFPLPPGNDYTFIWMERNYSQQADSMGKFLSALGIPVNRKGMRSLEASLPKDTDKSIKYLKRLGEVYRFSFEDCLLKTSVVIERICDIIPGLNASIMPSVIINRGVECYSGLLERELIEKEKQRRDKD